MLHRVTITALGLAACTTLLAPPRRCIAQAAPAGDGRAEVLVVGVYHMSNPGSNVFNTTADDVLSPRRQAEIAEVIEVLERFRPTRIAVEHDFSDDGLQERFAEYLAGGYELTRNETDQLGFRLARALGHDSVHPVDVHGDFPYPRVAKYAAATGRGAELAELQKDGARRAKAFGTFLASHTVLEALVYLNAEARVAEDVGGYFRLAGLGEPWDWAGADLVADWFRRNMRIYTNIARLADGPDERVLVIYGAGHLGWLRHAFGSNPDVRLRTLAEVAGRSGGS